MIPIPLEDKMIHNDGKAIYCPKCDESNRVYHFTWSAITCGGCKEMVDKTEWNLNKHIKLK